MTLKEAKKILNKEGFQMALAKEVVNQTGAMREFEKPEVCEAIKVANANRWTVALSPTEWDEREARLKKEYEKNTKAPGSGVEQPEEKIRIICCSASPKADFYYKHFLNEGNPALKESASQFNDALLDEQAKEIESLRDKCKKYADILDSVGDKLRELKAENRRIKDSDLNLEGLTYATRELKEKNKEIAQLTKENEDLKSWRENQNREISLNTISFINETKRLGKEISRLNKIIHKKNLKIEELGKESSRHLEGKIKMFGENVDLEQMLKDKDAVLPDVAEELRLSKIREKNLTEVGQKYMKENEELKKKLADKVVDKIDAQALKSAESALAYKEKVIAEKDEVIADLGKELKAQKALVSHISKICDSAKINLNLREKQCKKLKEALEEKTNLIEMVRNASKEYCDYGVAANEFIKELASLYVLANNTGIINDEILERCKNYQTYGFPANCNRETKKEINDIASGKAKVVGADNAEEGGDHSGKIVLCGKDFVKKLKENGWFDFSEKKHKEKSEELSKVADEALSSCFDLVKLFIIKSEK